ncbi:receptor for retinol uptake STRA6-like [Porites lutea]|uniref:receptor for retinol uptake STRA6-like n=2 Tax=Porites lutea TaxID=51062 RepID=UPI003CC5E85B
MCMLSGHLSMGIVLWLVVFVPALFLKHIKPVREWCLERAESVMPAFIMSVVLYLFQLFLVHYVFRDRDFPRIVITVDNRRLFSIMSYFFFFFNILVGLFSGFLRIILGIVLGVVFLARIDRSTLMQGFQRLDRAFVAYLGFINLLVAQSHPVMLLFCQLLIDRDKVHQPNPESPAGAQSENPDCSKETGVASVYTRERRLPRMSQKAFNRWHLTMTLLRNPCLIKYRKRVRRSRATSVSLRSIGTDLSELVPA